MEDPNIDPSPAELAMIEAELPEWERLAVRDYWDAVVAEELIEAPLPVSALKTWSFKPPQGRAHQVWDGAEATVLRFVPGGKAPVSLSESEAA